MVSRWRWVKADSVRAMHAHGFRVSSIRLIVETLCRFPPQVFVLTPLQYLGLSGDSVSCSNSTVSVREVEVRQAGASEGGRNGLPRPEGPAAPELRAHRRGCTLRARTARLGVGPEVEHDGGPTDALPDRPAKLSLRQPQCVLHRPGPQCDATQRRQAPLRHLHALHRAVV